MTTINQISNIELTIASAKMNLRAYKNKLRILKEQAEAAETVGDSFTIDARRIEIEGRINAEETRLHDARMKAVKMYTEYYELDKKGPEATLTKKVLSILSNHQKLITMSSTLFYEKLSAAEKAIYLKKAIQRLETTEVKNSASISFDGKTFDIPPQFFKKFSLVIEAYKEYLKAELEELRAKYSHCNP